MKANTYKPSTTEERLAAQDAANVTRFFSYNNTRIKHKLPPFSFTAFLTRKHAKDFFKHAPAAKA